MPFSERITMAHGSGGEATGRLIESIFAKYLSNEYLDRMEDSTVVKGFGHMALTTDSFVVKPLEFPGGDIGRLAVCGTVNDLLMSGARPAYLTAGFVLEEGLETALLKRVVRSMAETAKEAGVLIVAGDTKVIEGSGGMIINTSGTGEVPEGRNICPSRIAEGDALIVTGTLGDHHAAILGARMEIENDIISDAAPLNEMVGRLMDSGIDVHAMRDLTRGGLGTVLNEFASASSHTLEVDEDSIRVSVAVRGFADILGLDPIYMGNEGKAMIAVDAADAGRAVELIRSSRYGSEADVVGRVLSNDRSEAVLRTSVGGRRVIRPMYGEGLPRIC